MVTSATETDRRIRWVMYAAEILLIVGAWVWSYGRLTKDVEYNAAQIDAMKNTVEQKLDRQMFELHKGHIEQQYRDINQKIDILIQRAN
jgi:tRNA G10  N-methylase Trm11